MEMPITGSGYSDNPLAVLKVKTPPDIPVTVDDHVSWLVIRATGLAHWTKQNRVESEAVILEMLARMEGTIQSLRTMIKSGPDKDQDKFDAFLSHLGE